MDDETSFFERERDKLTREITAVRHNLLAWLDISLIAEKTATGFRRLAIVPQRSQP